MPEATLVAHCFFHLRTWASYRDPVKPITLCKFLANPIKSYTFAGHDQHSSSLCPEDFPHSHVQNLTLMKKEVNEKCWFANYVVTCDNFSPPPTIFSTLGFNIWNNHCWAVCGWGRLLFHVFLGGCSSLPLISPIQYNQIQFNTIWYNYMKCLWINEKFK